MPYTRTYESSILIRAPRELVWARLSDVAAWPDWLPTVDQVQPLDGTQIALGRRFVVHQPKLRPATWQVTEFERTRFAWVARSPGLRMLAEHIVTPASPALSKVVLRYSFSGPLGIVVSRVFRSTTQQYLATEAAALKQLLEQ